MQMLVVVALVLLADIMVEVKNTKELETGLALHKELEVEQHILQQLLDYYLLFPVIKVQY